MVSLGHTRVGGATILTPRHDHGHIPPAQHQADHAVTVSRLLECCGPLPQVKVITSYHKSSLCSLKFCDLWSQGYVGSYGGESYFYNKKQC